MEEEQVTITLPVTTLRLLIEVLETSESFNKSIEIMRGNAIIDLHQTLISKMPQPQEEKKVVRKL